MVAGIAVATVIAILLVATIAIYLRQGLVATVSGEGGNRCMGLR
jgi:hypothetical protein